MDAFQFHAQLTAEDIEYRQAACQSIEDILRPIFPSSSLQIIGSTISGLGLKGCDLDLSFQANNHTDTSVIGEKVILTKEIEEGKIPVSAFPILTHKQKLHFLRKVLKESDVVGTIIPGRFPILSFSYKGLNIDLGLDNFLGVHGTNFMTMCEKLDSRFAPLFRCIIYWAKHHRLCGGAMKFKSYGMFLLLVFFLQRKGILPTVEIMFEKTEFQKNLENWSYDVCKFVQQIKKSENVQSTEELLQEFFFFYANFDFSYVICTTTSESVKGKEFINGPKNSMFELNSISIQDPMNLNWNVTTGVNWKYCRHFAKELLAACEVFQERWFPAFSTTAQWGLLALIDSLASFKDLNNTKNVTLNLPVASFVNSQSISQKVYEIFSYCLDFRCSSLDDKLLHKLEKSDELNCLEEKVGTLVSRFQCVASDTWMGRSTFGFHQSDVNGICSFETEHKISKQMSLSHERSDVKNEFVFLCECRYHDGCLYLTLEPIYSDFFIPKLAIFLKYYIPKCINKQ